MTTTDPTVSPTPAAESRHVEMQLVRAQLQQAATDLVAAHILECRADRLASPTLVALLRERADERRRRAARLRADARELFSMT
jgi:hypothetical protein